MNDALRARALLLPGTQRRLPRTPTPAPRTPQPRRRSAARSLSSNAPTTPTTNSPIPEQPRKSLKEPETASGTRNSPQENKGNPQRQPAVQEKSSTENPKPDAAQEHRPQQALPLRQRPRSANTATPSTRRRLLNQLDIEAEALRLSELARAASRNNDPRAEVAALGQLAELLGP